MQVGGPEMLVGPAGGVGELQKLEADSDCLVEQDHAVGGEPQAVGLGCVAAGGAVVGGGRNARGVDRGREAKAVAALVEVFGALAFGKGEPRRRSGQARMAPAILFTRLQPSRSEKFRCACGS